MEISDKFLGKELLFHSQIIVQELLNLIPIISLAGILFHMDKKAFVIGITGNIASGKSVVRNLLANMGAYTIDADLTAQDAYLPGTPTWHAILETFGEDLKTRDGQINRSKLGRIVFSDPDQLAKLEEIVHPFVTEAISEQMQSCSRSILVVEAIKLIESDIARHCDQIWTVAADEDTRLKRLVEHRALSEEIALSKIKAQSPQEEKIARSDQVIWTDGNYEKTYRQTLDALNQLKLPTSYSYTQEYFSIETLSEVDHPWLKSVFERQMSKELAFDQFFQLLGAKLVPIAKKGTEAVQCHRIGVRQTLALLTNQFPIKSELMENPESLRLLQSWLQGAYEILIVPAISMSTREAWQEDFLPGEDYVNFYPKQSFETFLKEYGLMPGEVWIKSLKDSE